MLATHQLPTSNDDQVTPSDWQVARKKYADIDASFLREWQSLENRSVESNVFLSPALIIPAVENLMPGERPRIITVRDHNGSLVGLAIFHGVTASKTLPLPHLRTIRTQHSFRSGFLIDAAVVETTVACLLDALEDAGWYGVEFTEQWLDSPMMQSISDVCASRKYEWTELSSYQRAGFSPERITEQHLNDYWSKSRRKSLRQNITRLEKLGDWTFRIVRNGEDFSAAVERFLTLEHAGWKGEEGSSLKSTAYQQRFFREAVAGLAEHDCVFFAELLAGDSVIGSTSNFISANTVFAFKTGWDPEYSRVSPGIIMETELLRRSAEILSNVKFVDSCSKDDSYLAKLWPEKLRIGSGLLTLKRRSRWIAAGFDQLRNVKRQANGLLGR